MAVDVSLKVFEMRGSNDSTSSHQLYGGTTINDIIERRY